MSRWPNNRVCNLGKIPTNGHIFLSLGLSLLALIITGLQMLGVLRQWPGFSR